MATVAAPYGLRPVGSLSGAYTGKLRQLKMTNSYTTSIFYGDPVALVAAGTLEKATATNVGPIVGVFLGCVFTDPNSGQRTFKNWWTASVTSTDNFAYVADDPDLIFQCQSDTAIAQADMGINVAMVQTAGSTVTGMSRVAISGASTNTSSTLPLRIIGFVNGPFSAVGDAKTDCLVTINTHQYRSVGITGI
jgi:hypothetical protein